jgi:hypothetical protein
MRHQVLMHTGPLPDPAKTLERYLLEGGVSLLQAVFQNSFFASPDAVRARTPYYPDRARLSRQHYPGIVRGGLSEWKGRSVRCGDNSRAQMAWAKYTGREIERGSGYGVRHIWGCPWDPYSFTAGWNLCYMPFWAGMLTEDQHPHDLVVCAVRQASWDLFFGEEPVCEWPAFVANPGFDLASVLNACPIRVLVREVSGTTIARSPASAQPKDLGDRVRALRRQSNQSWSNIEQALLARLGRRHTPFGTANVEAASKSLVSRIQRETGAQFEDLLQFVAAERRRRE